MAARAAYCRARARSAARAALIIVSGCSGRSRAATLPRPAKVSSLRSFSRVVAARSVKMRNGKSDQAGWRASTSMRRATSDGVSVSSATTAAPAPASTSRTRASPFGQTSVAMPACSSTRAARAASLPDGVSTRTALSTGLLSADMPDPSGGAGIEGRHAREHALEALERLADVHAAVAEEQLADRVLVPPRALLEHRDRLLELALGLEV